MSLIGSQKLQEAHQNLKIFLGEHAHLAAGVTCLLAQPEIFNFKLAQAHKVKGGTLNVTAIHISGHSTMALLSHQLQEGTPV